MYLGSWKIDDYMTFPCNTHKVSGDAFDADAVPTYRVYEDETATAITSGSFAKLDDANTLGFYTERVQLTAALGFEKNKTYTIYITATVDSKQGTMSHSFQIGAAVDTIHVGGTIQTGNDNGADINTLITNQSDWTTATGFNTTIPPTVTAIRQEMDSNSTKMAPSQTLGDYKATGFATLNPPSQVLADYKATGFSTHGDPTSAIETYGDLNWITATGFNTTTPPTVIQIRTEMDTNSTKMAPSQTLADCKATGFSTHADPSAGIESHGDLNWTTATGFNTVVPDAAGVAPTVVEIRTEMDTNSTKMAPSQVLADYKATGFSTHADPTAGIESHGDSNWTTATGFNTTTPPTVIQIRTEMDTNSTKMAPSQTIGDYKATGFSTHTADNVKTAIEAAGTKLTLALEDTAELQTNQGNWTTATGFATPTNITAGIITTTTNLTNAPTIGDLTATMKASINTEIVDVIKVDTVAEMAQGILPVAPTIEGILNTLYRKLRNKSETTENEDSVYNDAGTIKLIKATLSDNGTTFTKGEYGSGA